MKSLLLLRHGKSSWKDTNLNDHDRPLKERGKNDAKRMGQLLTSIGLIPNLICCSSAKRAQDTVKYLLEFLLFDGEILFFRTLYHGYIDDYIDVLNGLSNGHDCVMIVGHNPGLEEFISNLTEIDEWLPTGALAQLELDYSEWCELNDYSEGKLINVWRPREISI